MAADLTRGGLSWSPCARGTPAYNREVQSSHMPDPEIAGAVTSDWQAPGAEDADVSAAVDFVHHRLSGGDDTDVRVLRHAMGTLGILRGLDVGPIAQVAAVLFGSPSRIPLREIQTRFGPEVSRLVESMRKIRRLKEIHRAVEEDETGGHEGRIEVLRRMTMAMSVDIQVVLIRLASRLQTLRRHVADRDAPDASISRETLDVLAPLANRLGLWQLKWELEDLSFRFLWPEEYKRLAKQLEERRVEREDFVEAALARLRGELERSGIRAELSGRPKHLFSIRNKMRRKGLTLPEIQDLRGLRVIVADIDDCYAALGAIHGIWQAVPEEYDDYVSRPKPNGYRSLHTVVVADDGRPLEIQIRTAEMHRFAEYGVAAHWRYKEGRTSGRDRHDDEVAWLRQLLAWQGEIGQSLGSGAMLPGDAGHSTIFVLTPQARVIELPIGATPVDFAYHVHTQLGHRCRGARVDGVMVPLTTRLENGQTVEIIAAKEGGAKDDGPSRDWLNPQLGFVSSNRARAKVRQWFNALDNERDIAHGRERVEKVLQREGATSLALDEYAARLGYDDPGQLFVAVAKEEIGPRLLEAAAHGRLEGPASLRPSPDEEVLNRARASTAGRSRNGVLVVGVGSLMTQLAKCCRPAPPDAIAGFVTRGRGVSVHRVDCPTLRALAEREPERRIETSWSETGDHEAGGRPLLYPVDIDVHAADRSGLLRDISDVLAKQRTNVVAVSTRTRQGHAVMRFTIEVADTGVLDRSIAAIAGIDGIQSARRH
ncbi:MAG: bifunctional (p)ppGpp synthetase/guanosine-3',5'-bis(diphosphate) 3'-pyrophosphohydrolase [Burkholderiaceae bacterium]